MQSGSTPSVKDYFSDLETPNTGSMALQLEELVQQGTLSPEQAQAIMVERSAMNDVSTDPALKQAQMDALNGLQDISGNGGMTAMDKANLSKIQTEEDASSRGKREAILSNAQARGMGGSGLELMSQMKNQQDSATRQSQRDMDVAAQAQQRALEALMQGGQMAGNMQSQDFSQKASVANANDAISKFNAQNQQQVGLANTAANNIAQAANLDAKQKIHDSNIATRNSAQVHNKNLIQQNYENELKKRTGKQNVAGQNAQNSGQNSQNEADATNRTIGTGLTVASMFSDERGKEDIEPFDASDFLDSLTGYKYKYKDAKHGAGQHVGVMAQDLEKTEAGSKMVVDTPEGKVVEYAKSGPATFASLANLNDRLRKLEQGE